MKKITFLLFLLSLQFLHAQSPLVLNGESVAFMGDSITAAGARSNKGYVRLVESGLKANDIAIQVIPAGVSGNTSKQMLARLDSSVLSKKPTWMTLSCGVNDVWHQEKAGGGVQLEDYKKNITEIVDDAQKTGIKVMILTSTLIGEDLNGISNVRAVPYNAFLRELAQQRKLPLADLNQEMREEWAKIQQSGTKERLTIDGVHMNVYGNLIMARGILKAFGLNEAQLEKAEAFWKADHAFTPMKDSL